MSKQREDNPHIGSGFDDFLAEEGILEGSDRHCDKARDRLANRAGHVRT